MRTVCECKRPTRVLRTAATPDRGQTLSAKAANCPFRKVFSCQRAMTRGPASPKLRRGGLQAGGKPRNREPHLQGAGMKDCKSRLAMVSDFGRILIGGAGETCSTLDFIPAPPRPCAESAKGGRSAEGRNHPSRAATENTAPLSIAALTTFRGVCVDASPMARFPDMNASACVDGDLRNFREMRIFLPNPTTLDDILEGRDTRCRGIVQREKGLWLWRLSFTPSSAGGRSL